MLSDTLSVLRASRPRLVLSQPLTGSSTSCCCPFRTQHALHTSTPQLSGSNHWSKIRHKKAANDASKADAYGVLSRDILSAVRSSPLSLPSSTNPEHNARLAGLLRKARDLDIPKDKIEATLAKARAQGEQGSSVVYEVLGPAPLRGSQPVALVVECSTNSPTRTHAKMKEALNRSGGHRLSSTSHLFAKTGLVRVALGKEHAFDALFEAALEEGAEEVREVEEDSEDAEEGPVVEIHCSPTNLKPLLKHLQTAPHAYSIISAEQAMLPSGPRVRLLSSIGSVTDDAQPDSQDDFADPDVGGWVDDAYVERLEKLAEALEEGADCQRIWSNLEGWGWPAS